MNTPTPQTAAPNSAAPKSNGGRHLGLLILASLVLLGGLVYGVYWFINARHFETTDDAYVNGDVVQVSSQQPGTVLAVHVDDTQTVAAGTALVELDPADADVAMSNDEAELARSLPVPWRLPLEKIAQIRRIIIGALGLLELLRLGLRFLLTAQRVVRLRQRVVRLRQARTQTDRLAQSLHRRGVVAFLEGDTAGQSLYPRVGRREFDRRPRRSNS